MPFGTIGRWISGDDPNKRARQAEREEQYRLNDIADKRHEYEIDVFEADRDAWNANRQFAYDTAITNWEYSNKIQDYQYAKSLAAYEKSEEIYKGQIDYNQQAESIAVSDQEAYIQDLSLNQAFQREAMKSDLENEILLQTTDLANKIKSESFNVMTEIKSAGINKLEQGTKLYGIKSGRRLSSESTQQALNEITKKNTFEKEAKFIESLRKSGKAALGQAGVSRAKNLQSTAAEAFRDLVILDSSLSGSRNKAAVDLLKLQVDASIAETQVGLNLDRIRLGVTTAQERAKLNISAAQEQAQLRINAAQDEVTYNNKILDANMQSAATQMARNINQIALEKQNADLQAKANLNLFPEELDYAPEPQMTPERKFVAPIKTEAPIVPKGPRVSTGIDSVFEVVGQVGDMVGTVMGFGDSLGGWDDIFNFGGKADIGSLTGNTFGTFANSGVSIGDLTGGGSFPGIGSVTGNNIGNFGGGTSYF